MRAYDEEQANGDFRLADDSDDDGMSRPRNGMNGHGSKAYETIELQNRK
jgi:hypothetical protein